jgi:uncharacterized membrane protein YeaQ/YmgE (transglycosylase-associated protein family)
MLAFMWWLLIGLVAGGLARMLMPGRQSMGLMMTMVLGLVGSVIGGMISSAVWGYRPNDSTFQTAGVLMSTVGAVIALAVTAAYSRRSQNTV